MLSSKIKTSYALGIIFILALFCGSLVWIENHYIVFDEADIVRISIIDDEPMEFEKIPRVLPPPVSMEKMKTKGCVADGLLSEYNPEREQYISLINRSNCYYLHRAIETWLTPPDFESIRYVMDRIKKEDVVYGMFIAEAIKTNVDYADQNTGRYFDFKKMCREGSENTWGEHSCIPEFSSGEYRDYIRYITRRAIDLGVQSFMFGQIYLQEGRNGNYAPQLVREIKRYAKKRGVNIVIGAQTGHIVNSEYLGVFDYIEGGIGLHSDGTIENGPCFSGRGGCWALLWHENFSSKAKNVFLHLDWTGIKSDDLDVFARMNREVRKNTLKNLHEYFIVKDMGFLMPFFGVLDKNNGGCYGPKKRFYSPDRRYSCDDEDAINSILKE